MDKLFPILVFLLLTACGGAEGEQNAIELADVAEEGGNPPAQPATAAPQGDTRAAAP